MNLSNGTIFNFSNFAHQNKESHLDFQQQRWVNDVNTDIFAWKLFLI